MDAKKILPFLLFFFPKMQRSNEIEEMCIKSETFTSAFLRLVWENTMHHIRRTIGHSILNQCRKVWHISCSNFQLEVRRGKFSSTTNFQKFTFAFLDHWHCYQCVKLTGKNCLRCVKFTEDIGIKKW